MVSFQDPFCNKHCFKQCLPVLSPALSPVLSPVLSLDYLVSCLDLDAVEATPDDYYICQLIAEHCEGQRSLQSMLPCIPDLSCFSLSLNNLEDSPAPVPSVPEAYADFAPLFQD